MYRIREVDRFDDDVADALCDLHRLTFFENAPMPEFDVGHWWLVFCDNGMPVAFAGLAPSTHVRNAGVFLSRRRLASPSRQFVAGSPDASRGMSHASQWMVLRRV